ncbi:hypothetical protein CU098_007182 [Rhizopus stolonifer]|uniref:Uncharacterized protein n=1 Tax=Rhizopus stolonifer TaxID=4846 RepID=A0A367J5D3_RHIST|nr:hypothetical protein CU098_007182 [Rhizopus stolonifer]
MSLPEPIPSISTPVISSTDMETESSKRPRRHTITRPDSAMALLSDMEEELDDEEQQQTFDRISGILTNLIQEANEAVHGIEKERVQLMKSSTSTKRPLRVFTSSTIISSPKYNNESRIPRPRKSRTSLTPSSSHHRNGSTSSSHSTQSSIFSPISTSTSATLLSRSPSPTLTHSKKQMFRHHTRSCPTTASIPMRRSITPRTKRQIVSDPVMESFKRLDTSMALVDSLSRDLATPKTKETNKIMDSRLTILLLVPLLHLPHSLITMIFDFCSSSNPLDRNASTFSFSWMFFWACLFTITNLMVDQITVAPNYFAKLRRMSLPGSYSNNKPKKTVINKQTWIPAARQLHSSEATIPVAVRRNSI